MRTILASALLLVVCSSCRDLRENPRAQEGEEALAPPSAEKGLPAPEPGRMEDVRSRTDPVGDEAGAREAGVPEERVGTSGVPAEAAASEEERSSGTVISEEGEEPMPGGRARFPRPEHVRGIYLNAWTAGSRGRRSRLLDMARRTEINSFVIDIKDASGFISHATQITLAREVGATGEIRVRDLAGFLDQLEQAGIYPIARIVVAKDPVLTEGRPDLAIQDSAGGPWQDQNGVRWLNLHHPEVWEYHVELAREVARAGFPEIQWDYVRFPDAPEALLSRAVYPEQNGRTKAQAVREFLGYSRKVLGAEGIQVTADVFGVTTSYRNDVGIGQVWESFIDQVDVALPMVYPSHYWAGSYGYQEPNAYPYEVVRRALRDATRRSATVGGAGATRPWLQDFTLGEPAYGSPEVRAQIQAAYDVGIQEWILWNPGSRYTEAALIPARGLPSWLEPVMRVGGEVVAVSKRFEVLGESSPLEGETAGDSPVLDDPAPPVPEILPGARTLPKVPIPDTAGARGPNLAGSGRLSGRRVR